MNAETKVETSVSVSTALALRAAHWNDHPIVAAKAKLPTPAVLTTIAIIEQAGRRQRESVAFWAHPVTGKTFCIEVLKAELPVSFTGAGVFVYEVKPNDREDDKTPRQRQTMSARESLLLRDLLEEMEYEARIQHTLPGKRRQVRKALLGIAGPGRHLFFILDEAQGLGEQELQVLKSIINWLSRNEIRVTTILFGQVELVEQRDRILTQYRSDLDIRFTKSLYEFCAIKSGFDLYTTFEACDTPASEFPVGSHLCYTQFLFPLAFAVGFRMASLAEPMWAAFIRVSPFRKGESGIAMEYVASALSELVAALRNADSHEFSIGEAELEAAVRASGYARRKPVRKPTNSSKKVTQ